MIASVDIETEGLDARKFVCGTVVKDSSETAMVFKDKKLMWEYIKELGEKQRKRGKVLNLYAHNHAYDYYGYADLRDKRNVIYADRPFIVTRKGKYVHKERLKELEVIKFLDTWAIFKMSLAQLGEMIGIPKEDTPEELKTGDIKDLNLEIDVIPYMVNDAQICLKAIQFLKEKLKQEGIGVKRLMTIHQIAINALMTKIKKLPYDTKFFLEDKKKGITRKTFRATEIHEAYRGGRVECFKTGFIENVNYIDCNSLYPYCATLIPFPDLRTERKIFRPLEFLKLEQLLEKEGLSRVLLYNEDCEIGLMPIRTPVGNYFPKKDKYLIGTYTHIELRKALEEGYKILAVDWSVTFMRADHNPLKEVMNDLYEKRIRSENKFDYWFYKSIMNSSIGKMAQTRTGQEIIIDSVEKAEEYLKRNYEIIKGVKLDYMYANKDTSSKVKPYYAPIIPCFINALARCLMFDQYKKIPKEDLVYTDTDSILFIGDHIEKFPISQNIGEFKIEERDQKAIIYGRKTYMIGTEIKISGIRKRDVKPEDFEEGYITSKQMVGIKSSKDLDEVGSFKEEKRDLKEQLANHNKTDEMFKEEDLFIDDNIDDISYFLEFLPKHLNTS